MITARLRQSSRAPELLVECYHRIRDEARQERATLLKQARKRARTHARHARLVGHKSGVAQGERESAEKYSQLLERIEKTYQEAFALAREDALRYAFEMAEKVIDDCIILNPSIIQGWLDAALNYAPITGRLSLLYHPRYEPLFAQLHTSLPAGIEVRASSALGTADFKLCSEMGAVECSWRDLLRTHCTPKQKAE